MAPGDEHNLNGYVFRETLFGPLVERRCVDCDDSCFFTPEAVSPRCVSCARRHFGLDWRSRS